MAKKERKTYKIGAPKKKPKNKKVKKSINIPEKKIVKKETSFKDPNPPKLKNNVFAEAFAKAGLSADDFGKKK
jgi:predicted ATP-dependent endonuclease of OLD family